jgi:hypothetical protein
VYIHRDVYTNARSCTHTLICAPILNFSLEGTRKRELKSFRIIEPIEIVRFGFLIYTACNLSSFKHILHGFYNL